MNSCMLLQYRAMVVDTSPHSGKAVFTCRGVARELGISTSQISLLGRAQKWPGATGNRWRVPAGHVKKLKTQIAKGGSLL